MHHRWITLIVCATGLLIARPLPADPPSPTANPESSESARETTLRERLAQTIDLTRRRYLSTDRHTPWQIVHALKAYGRELQLQQGPDGRFINAVDFLCNEAKVGGQRIFTPTEHGLKTIAWSGMEGHPNQFLSALAQSGLPLDHPVLIDGQTYTVGHLVAQAKHDYYSGQEASWTLIALSTYGPLDASWTNGYGQVLRIEDLVEAEVAVEPTTAACGGTHNLYALAYALNRYKAMGNTPTGVWQKAAEKLARYAQLTRSLQNEDGLLSSSFYRGAGWSSDSKTQLDTTGHMLEWLALSLSEEELRQDWVTRAFEALLGVFDRTSTQPLEVGALYHATRALLHYQQRRFGEPAPSKPVGSEDVSADQMGRDQFSLRPSWASNR